MNKCKAVLIVVAILAHANIAIASDKESMLNEYCAKSGVDIERTIKVGSPIAVVPNAGPFSMIETESQLDLNSDLKTFLTGEVGLSQNCSEFLIVNGQLEGNQSGDPLARVYFDFDQSKLTDASIYILNKIVKLASLSDSQFLLNGHTDSIGYTEYNAALGERRAESVGFYLQSKGVSEVGISSSGETDPIASNTTAEGRAKNRRVEIMTN
ncbi:OmpA family protein [Vibrio sp. T187]|uniref:OmpA family protein n=1 Tax=Vibrio TaxID=662 RepID=UPI0010C9874A|nr:MULTISPECIES: OmpA family protein [Vibrio]MBW3694712.1 OmpA family protein [Vibrio sp. T187]